ncbi:unnamed protein product [Soboliphyme baturini]|uniref:Ubiquinone biosynthesis protein ubiB n=1 Tax=Soboliphyme baturini TaxID=241478 RepID=A0A183IQ66_9BILA|nr:unnamed protein product [Soboliphyme baturini]
MAQRVCRASNAFSTAARLQSTSCCNTADASHKIIRANQACITAVAAILKGQMAASDRIRGEVVMKQLQREKDFIARFDDLLIDRRVRPSILSPLWNAGGFAFGFSSKMLSERFADVCISAVFESLSEGLDKYDFLLSSDLGVLFQRLP